MGPKTRPTEQRFWAKVDKRGPDECWPWTASKHNFGYGKIYIGKRPNGKALIVDAHRYSWELHNGAPVPDGLVVRHTCDNPECVNPGHLLIGTMADNSRDARVRNRNSVKLTPKDVLEIRARRASGEKIVQLGHEYGVTHVMISSICTRRTWRHV